MHICCCEKFVEGSTTTGPKLLLHSVGDRFYMGKSEHYRFDVTNIVALLRVVNRGSGTWCTFGLPSQRNKDEPILPDLDRFLRKKLEHLIESVFTYRMRSWLCLFRLYLTARSHIKRISSPLFEKFLRSLFYIPEQLVLSHHLVDQITLLGFPFR